MRCLFPFLSKSSEAEGRAWSLAWAADSAEWSLDAGGTVYSLVFLTDLTGCRPRGPPELPGQQEPVSSRGDDQVLGAGFLQEHTGGPSEKPPQASGQQLTEGEREMCTAVSSHHTVRAEPRRARSFEVDIPLHLLIVRGVMGNCLNSGVETVWLLCRARQKSKS